MKLKHNIFLGSTNEKFHLESCSISIVNYDKPVSEDWHFHEDMHLSLILQGGNLESRNKNDIQVTSGKIMAYDQGEIHRNRFTAFPSKNLNLEFKSEFFCQNGLNFNDLDLSEARSIECYLSLINIYSELQINDNCTTDTIYLSLKSLFTRQKLSVNRPEWLQQLREIIHDRWDEFIPLDELAQTLNVHPVTISKYFKRYYHGTLADYMRKVKIQRALHYLFHTGMSITEIAATCGFSDHSHMIRVFKKYVGGNPKNIRRL